MHAALLVCRLRRNGTEQTGWCVLVALTKNGTSTDNLVAKHGEP